MLCPKQTQLMMMPGEIQTGTRRRLFFSTQFSYETLASAEVNSQDEDWIYHRNCNLYYVQNSKSLRHSVKRRILPWRKRKLRFRSHKTKEEPLLKKNYRKEGGEDIDFVCRQLSSSDDSGFAVRIHFFFSCSYKFFLAFSLTMFLAVENRRFNEKLIIIL